ncbi:MAG: hypothetical protein AAGA03_10720, partial [Planctomycetota bacterium]
MTRESNPSPPALPDHPNASTSAPTGHQKGKRRALAAGNSAAPAIDGSAGRWLPLVMSAVFHVVLLVALGLLLAPVVQGTGDDPDRPIGIAMVHRLPDRTEYADAQMQPVNPDAQADSS